MERRCSICSVQEFKYKCPTCRVPYCSVTCYKSHFNNCVPTAAQDLTDNKTGEQQLYQYKFPTEDTVPIELLSKLGSNQELVQLLKNSHLQDFLKTVDSAQNPRRLMRQAMQEPLFLEFVDECLKVVAPTRRELSDQEILDSIKESFEENQ